MGLWDAIFGEFIDVIEWLDESNNTLVYRFKRYQNEIKYGAKLIVRQAQSAVFVNEGEIADVLGPGIYELETKNLPILSTLQHWDHGFNSPFKAEVYFCNLRRFIDLKWGTKNPIILRDKEFGIVRLRAFGTYEIRIDDPQKVIKELVGTNPDFTIEDVSGGLRNLVITKFTSIVGESNIPVIDLAGNYEQLSEYILENLREDFEEIGFELLGFRIENISVPEAVEKVIDERSSMGAIGNLEQYLKYKSANALENSSDASSMIGMGAGFAMASKLAKSFENDSPTPKKEYIPEPLETLYYIAKEKNPDGPYSIDEIKDMVKKGEIKRGTKIWYSGLDMWKEADKIDELKELLNLITPPPLV
jgi:membrane protease subunit (stomatin/prohibitin family)